MDNGSKVVLPFCLGVLSTIALPVIGGAAGVDVAADVAEKPVAALVVLVIGFLVGWFGMAASRFGAVVYTGYKDKKADVARYDDLKRRADADIEALKAENELLKSQLEIACIVNGVEGDGLIDEAVRRERAWRHSVL